MLNVDVIASEMDVEHAYTYEPLKEPDKSIRLIKILSTTPRIRCEFTVVSLEDSPVFSALSYVWGDGTITEPVTVDGGTLHVTVNLASAIRDVYGQWSKGQLVASGGEQWLWADAICIDQKNFQEKNHQVPLMEKIYPNAHRVFAWLGSDDDEVACKAVDAYRFVLDKISQLPGYSYIQEQTKEGRVPWPKKEDVSAKIGVFA
jgi:hypothetical protein